MSVVHMAGPAIELRDRYLRQRCAWCGALLVDEDYRRISMPGEWKRPGTYRPRALVRITEGNPSIAEVLSDVASARLPEDFCGAAVWAANPPDAKEKENDVKENGHAP